MKIVKKAAAALHESNKTLKGFQLVNKNKKAVLLTPTLFGFPKNITGFENRSLFKEISGISKYETLPGRKKTTTQYQTVST